jgi:hypothetical protein
MSTLRADTQLIQRAANGDDEAVNKIRQALSLQEGLKVWFDKVGLRATLIKIGRMYGYRVRELAAVFGIHHSNIQRSGAK